VNAPDVVPAPEEEAGGRPASAVAEGGDEATRALCAAVHRNEHLARAIIRAFLIEEVGAVPPSPGLDAAAVLGDAVAAHTRRRLRDAVVLVLLVALAFLDPVGVAVWAGVALLLRFKLGPDARHRARVAGVPGALGLLAFLVAVQWLTGSLFGAGGSGEPTLALAVLLLAVLTADRYIGMRFLRGRFQPERFVADRRAATSALERWLRGLGRNRFAGQLERFASADEYHPDGAGLVDVIVHLTETPFVGAGFRLSTQPVQVLAKSGKRPKPIDVADLHRHVVEALARPAAVGVGVLPVERLHHRHQVVVAADHLVRLVRAGRTPFAGTVFGRLDRPPERRLPPDDVVDVIQQKVDGVRYYSCFRAESWSRNLVVSCYLHITTRFGGVQVNLTPCVLPPVDPWYDQVDRATHFGWGWPSSAAADFVALPLTVRGRLVSVLRPPRPRGRYRYARTIEPERYGAGRSLRERASSGLKASHWYEADDAAATAAAVSKRLFDEIASYLKERGYDVSQLRKDAAGVVQNYSIKITGGNFVETKIATGDINEGAEKDEPEPEK
jgi:hypothetical protein